MKYKLLPKYLFAAVFALSIFSFAYVNIHAACFAGCTEQPKQLHAEQSALMKDEEKEEAKIPILDVTLISRVLHIAQHLASSNR